MVLGHRRRFRVVLGSREGPHVPRSGHCLQIPKEFCIPAPLPEIPAGIPAGIPDGIPARIPAGIPDGIPDGIPSVITRVPLGFPDSCCKSTQPQQRGTDPSPHIKTPHPNTSKSCPLFPQSRAKSPIPNPRSRIPDPRSQIPALQRLVGLSFSGGRCSKFWKVLAVGEGSRC